MTSQFGRSHRRNNSTNHHSILISEQLEPRLLLTVNTGGSQWSPGVSSLISGTPEVFSASATLSASQNDNKTFDVRAQASAFSVQGVSSLTGATLKYHWMPLTLPSGGTVVFAKNSSSAAASNVLTFNKSGTYTVRISVLSGTTVVATTDMDVVVLQTQTRIGIQDSNGRPLSTGATLPLRTTTQQLTAVVLDQFSQPLLSQPQITWQTNSAPSGGTATITTSDDDVSISINKAGLYSLQATAGSMTFRVSLSATQALSTATLTTIGGNAIDPLVAMETSSSSHRINIRGLDQFGNAMASMPSFTWTTTSGPTGGNATVRLSSGIATVNFNRTGVYALRGVSGAVAVNFQVDVVPVLTRISIRKPDARELTSNGTTTITEDSYVLTPTALDQFGFALADQPEITWQTISASTGGTATFTASGSSVTAELSKAGIYSLRASSGGVLFNFSLSVRQVLTSATLKTTSGDNIDPTVPLQSTTTTQAVRVVAVDQFGTAMASLPSFSWSTTTVPTGGTAQTRLNSGVATATFTRSGLYAIRGVSGAMTVSFQVEVVPTLTRISVRKPDLKELASGGVVTVPSTGYNLTTVAFDQFAQPLTTQPEITWQTMTSPAGGTATLTPASDGGSVTVDRAGSYALRVSSGSALTNFTINFVQVMSQFRLLTSEGPEADPDVPISVSGISSTLTLQTLDQFGNAMSSSPSASWSTLTAPSGGTAVPKVSAGVATIRFNRPGDYTVRATVGGRTATAAFTVVSSVESIVALGVDGRTLTTSVIPILSASAGFTLRAFDQFKLPLSVQPEFAVAATTTPSGGLVSFTNTTNAYTATFSKAGSYALRATVDSRSVNLNYTVVSVATSLTVTPGILTVPYGVSQQFRAQAFDQFDNSLTSQPGFTWSATGGTITSTGFFTAGNSTGTFSVSARVGNFLVDVVSVVVITPAVPDGLLDPDLESLVDTFYVDGQISRTEMMEILRSAGSDGIVSATELADFRYLTSDSSPFVMPDFVQGLASDVVNSNPANLKFKGQTAGNLVAGSGSTLLNNLVDEWFLGADEPQLTNSGLSYQTTTGNLFNGTPSRADAKQGMLGDCYFIAAVAAIADRNPDSVRNMFLDNGDNTYTVRFYTSSGAADYVTVSRRLATQSNGTLAYSGYGLSVSSPATTIWIAIAEKAYAQWNESGNAGRDGSNRFSAIEGGWMGPVNSQVLGFQSSNFVLSSTPKQTLINSLSSSQAVTIGTQSYAASGLVGSHAYIVTAYEAGTDTFRLYNPWGTSHPGALTYAQLQANCSWFVVTNPDGTGGISSGVSSSTRPPRLISPIAPPATSTSSIALSKALPQHSTSVDVDQLTMPVSMDGDSSADVSTLEETSPTKRFAPDLILSLLHDSLNSSEMSPLEESLLDLVFGEFAQLEHVC